MIPYKKAGYNYSKNYVLPFIQQIYCCKRKIQQGILAEGPESGDGVRLETDWNAPGSTD